jgi:enoyl-[acyl-carrier protein] reductase II
MGTRFIATIECPAHSTVKQAIIDAGDTGTLAVDGIPGVLRALKTPLMERCVQKEAGGSPRLEITNLYDSGYIKGMLEGNKAEGTFVCGAGAGLINELKRATEVVSDIIKETEEITGRLKTN